MGRPVTMSTRGIIMSYRRPYVIAIVASLVINALMLTGPLFMLQIYGQVIPAHSEETLLALFALVVVLYASLGMLDLSRSRILNRISLQMNGKMRAPLFDLVMLRALQSNGAAASDEPLREYGIFTGFLGGPAVAAFFDGPLVFFYIAIIFLFHPLLGWFASGAAVVLGLLALINFQINRAPQEMALKSAAKAQGLLSSGVRAIEPLMAMGMSGGVKRRWLAADDDAQKHKDASSARIASIGSISKALRLFLQSSMLALGAWLVIKGEATAGVMIAASIILGRALQPVEQAIVHWRTYQRYRIARRKLDTFLSGMPPGGGRDKTTPEHAPAGRVDVRELFVLPPGGRAPVLENLNFSLPAGRMLLVTGGNGSGKSSLAKALAGVWPPARGKVSLDGADLRLWPREKLGRLTGYAPQDGQLVEGTIAQNISRLDEKPEDEAITRAAAQAHAAELIKAAGGYDRPVAPDGRNLSMGERKRIALARALYGDPVLLILDEPFAGLDGEGMGDLLKALKEMKAKGRSIVLIEHVPGLVSGAGASQTWEKELEKLADYLLVLDNGRQAAFKSRRRQEHAGAS